MRVQNLLLALMSFAFVVTANASKVTSLKISEVRRHSANKTAIVEDFHRILRKASLREDFITFEWRNQMSDPDRKLESTVRIVEKSTGKNKHYILEIHAHPYEWAATAYYGLQKMGFLFPHPRMQISPTEAQIRSVAGKTFTWQPRYLYRGFHFHTMHPSEWLQGFLMGKKEIARETIRWLARNGQNVGQVVLLEQDLKTMAANLSDLIDYAHDYGLSFGVNSFFNFMQQNAYRLIGTNSKLKALGVIPGDRKLAIRNSIKKLEKHLDFDFMTVDIGSSEFTSTSYERTISWMNTADEELRKSGRYLFVKVHCTAGQMHPKYGNFNFIPQYAHPTVGVLPHTVMYYGLTDENAPVYGRSDFKDMAEFLKAQSKKRPTWYYPETSYFIAMDIDVPLLLTDYLLARSADMDFIEKSGAQGQLNFTTGQELGYWLKDWTVALLANKEYAGRPLVALDLLGESRKVWEPIVEFQNNYFKKNLLLEELSSANLSDELPVNIITHERTVFRELRQKPMVLKDRIDLLKEAIANKPSVEGVKNDELKSLLEVTFLRLEHALYLRQALLSESQKQRRAPAWQGEIAAAQKVREQAEGIMKNFRTKYDRYPEALLFERNENLSSYPWGYGWTAVNLHFWKREEGMIEKSSYTPWFMNIYSIGRIVF